RLDGGDGAGERPHGAPRRGPAEEAGAGLAYRDPAIAVASGAGVSLVVGVRARRPRRGERGGLPRRERAARGSVRRRPPFLAARARRRPSAPPRALRRRLTRYPTEEIPR